MKTKSFLTIIFLLATIFADAQFVLTPNPDTVQIENYLRTSMSCVQNIQFTGDSVSYGTYEMPGLGVSYGAGIILTTGKAINASWPNSGNVGFDNTGLGSPVLNSISNQATTDASMLSFDIISCDTIYSLSFVFGSEGYPELIGSSFIDVCGIFVSGPNPLGGNYQNHNFALVPGTNLPVNIETINSTTNANFLNNFLVLGYDNLTAVINADIPIVPGEVYTIDVAIADVGDSISDSGILFWVNQETANQNDFTAILLSPYGSWGGGYGESIGEIYEGYPTHIHFHRIESSNFNNSPYTIYVEQNSNPTNAVMGVDFTLPDSIVIPTGIGWIDIPLITYADSIQEINEWFDISFWSICEHSKKRIKAQILDEYVFTAEIVQDTITACGSDAIFLNCEVNATGSFVSFLWSNGLTYSGFGGNASIFSTSYYYVTATYNNVDSIVDSVFVEVLYSPTINAVQLSDSCGFDGIDSQISGGTGPFSYLWNTGETTEDIYGLSSGAYQLTVTDGFGCETIKWKTINSTDPMTTSFSSEIFCADSLGTIFLTTNNGTPPYSYLWNTGDTLAELDSIPSGDYYVTITDSLGCTKIDSIIAFNPIPLGLELSYSTAGCLPSLASAQPVAGVAPYLFTWSSGNFGPEIVISQEGTYTVQVEDSLGCTYVDSFTIVADSSTFLQLESEINSGCLPNQGSIDLTINNGLSPISYTWSNYETSEDIDGLSPGFYSVSLTDANYCYWTSGFNVPTFPELTYSSIPTHVTNCLTLDNGQAEILIQSSNGPVSYVWSTGDTTSIIQNLVAGIYYFTVSDLCNSFINIAIINPPIPISLSIVPDIDCTDSIGSLFVEVNNGISPYSYLWNNGSTEAILDSIGSGNYSVIVTDSGGCMASDSLFVPDLEPLTIDALNYSTAGCMWSYANVEVSGGSPPYTYLWSNNYNTPEIHILPGTYWIKVQDALGCNVTDTFTIVADPSISLQFTQNIIVHPCSPTPVTLGINITNGLSPFTFLWSNGETTQEIDSLVQGYYRVTITDGNYCWAVSNFYNQPVPGVSISYTLTTNPVTDCQGLSNGSAVVSASTIAPPLSFLWSTGSTDSIAENLSPGIYYVTISDMCLDTVASIVIEPYVPISANIINLLHCYDSFGRLAVNVSNGTPPYTYLWNTGSTEAILDSVPAGDYYVTITDAFGCVSTDSFMGFNPIYFDININYSTAGCVPSMASVEMIGGTPPYGAYWSTTNYGFQTILGQAGLYWVKVHDIMGCTIIDTFSVVADTSAFLEVNENLILDPCSPTPGTTDYSVTNGMAPFTYIWSTWETTENIDSLFPGDYSLTLTDANYCYSVYDFSVPAFPEITLLHSINKSPVTNCQTTGNGSAQVLALSAAPPVSYMWSNGGTESMIQNLSSGIYYVTVGDLCMEKVDSVFIDIQYSLSVSLEVGDSYCYDSLGKVEALIYPTNMIDSMYLQNGITGDIYFPDAKSIFQSLPEASYTYTVIDTFGCSYTESVEILLVPSLLTPSISPAFCQGYPVTGSTVFQLPTYPVPGSNYNTEILPFHQESLSGGTLVTETLTDDHYWGPFPIGFDFNFFGDSVTNFYVGSNGWVSFSPLSSTTYDPWATHSIPNQDPTRPRNAIFALYRDWQPGSGTSIKYYITGTAPSRKLVINFIDVPLYVCSSIVGTFQVVLFEGSDIIDVNIIAGPSCSNWNSGKGVLGIQNASGTIGYTPPGFNNTNFQVFNYSVRYNPQKPAWYNSFGNLIGQGDTITFNVDSSTIYFCEAQTFCGFESVEISVPILNDYPQFFGPDQLLCPGDTGLLQLPQNYSGQWSTGTTGNMVEVIQPGEYSAYFSIADGLCTWFDTIQISFENMNYYAGLDTMICEGDNILIELDTAFSYL
ncbi:MAG: choice-of-anchor L domain-containing protein [Bacteroidales bacterium]|nr:choice-of-anchor L domain-containing protein [Bacteroidales bacterium]MCF8455218.1 choice-of-anchor L domain-containing protein [Bacteroidales bacterium]